MKQTAVEWLFEKILLTPLDIREINKCLEQAKAMEKEQIIEARNNGFMISGEEFNGDYGEDDSKLKNWVKSEEYYNETFKPKQP